jgi:hypothetical protein
MDELLVLRERLRGRQEGNGEGNESGASASQIGPDGPSVSGQGLGVELTSASQHEDGVRRVSAVRL